MKTINMKKIILVLIPVLFIFSGIQNSKADTFCTVDERIQGVGGGNAWSDWKKWCSTISTDKPTYNVGENISYLVNTVYDEYFCNEVMEDNGYGGVLVLSCTYYPPEPVTYTGTNFSMKNSSNATTTSINGTYTFYASGATPLSWLIPSDYTPGNYNLFVDDLYIGVSINPAIVVPPQVFSK